MFVRAASRRIGARVRERTRSVARRVFEIAQRSRTAGRRVRPRVRQQSQAPPRASVPALLHAGYVAALALMVGIAYSPHLWMGVVVFAGAIGWLLSYLVLPPRGAAGRQAATA